MPYKLNKIIFQRDNIKDYETHTHPLDTEIDFPFVAGKLQELVPKEHQYGKKSRLELSNSPLFNESGLTKLIPEVGPKGIYYLELRPGHKLKQLYVEPDDVYVDIYIGPKDTLIYSFYNPTRRNTIAITASIEKDIQVYAKIKSDLSDIHWRQYFVRTAMNKIEDKKTEANLSSNMTAKELADYIGVGTKTIRNWTSEGKIPSIKIGGAVRYPKERINNWLKTKEKNRRENEGTKMKLKSILVTILFILLYFNGYSQTSTQFKFTYSDEVSSKQITGRLILVLSADTLIDPKIPNPFRPFITFGMDFKKWKPGENLILSNHNSDGFLSNLDKLEGYYSLRAVVDNDSTSSLLFKDGTYYSDKLIIEIETKKSNVIDVKVNNVLSGQAFKDSENIKLSKIKSKLLSDFYNAPTYIEAAVLLPESYNQNNKKYYPVVFVFPGFGSTHIKVIQDDFQQKRFGMSGFGEEKIFVFLNQDCRYGFHVFANSDNNGPRATSFITEFIPALEKQYRIARKANGRFLIGHSSGAWAALWLQINYPDTFGMVWAGSPDPVDFHNFVGHNLYHKGANLFYNSEGKITSSIRTPGVNFTLKDWANMETALGDGGQLQSFEAVFGRKDKNGKPEQMFDRKTGNVFPDAIEHWKNYDINLFLQKNAAELKDKLAGKINIVVAENDDFFLDGAVKLLKQTLDSLNYKTNITFIETGGHNTWSDEIRTEMHKKMEKKYSEYSK